ncbi:MAG TPA: hypothetical protein VGA50_00620 [Kiloniellales bacterium]
MRKVLRCYAEGHDGDWEALCLDLDIAVQGSSFEEVFNGLNEAIHVYIESALELSSSDARRLLNRPAPLHLRLEFLWRSLLDVFNSNKNGRLRHSFTLPCTA